MEHTSPLQKKYDSLVHRMNGGGPHLVEGAPLYDEAIALLFESAVAGSEERDMARNCYALVNRFTPVTALLPDKIDQERIVTIFGNKSQFTGEAQNSSCTSCAMAFLRYVLPMGVAWDLQGSQVSNYVDIGKALYDQLRESIEKQKKLLSEEEMRNLGESFIHYQAFSTHEVAQYYDLGIISALPARQLPENILDFFRNELDNLERMLTPERKRVGVTIHCRDYTYSLVLFDTPKGREFVFFDSHGKAELHRGNPNAYIKYTFSRETMARFLAELLPHKPLDVDPLVLEDIIALGGSDELEGEANKYICYLMDLQAGSEVREEEFDFGSSWVVLDQSRLGGTTSTPIISQTSRRGGSGSRDSIETSFPSTLPRDGGKGPNPPSRINFLAIGLFALFALGLYTYRKPIMNVITSFTTKLGLVSTKSD